MYARRVGTAVLVVLCACQRSAPITVAPPPRSVFEIVWDGIQAPEFNGKLPYYELGELSVGAEYLKTMPGRVQEQAHQSKDGFEFHPDFGDVARQESIAPAVAVNVLKRAVDTMKLAFEQQETFVEDDARMLHLSRAYRRQGEVTYEPRPDRLLYVSLRRTLQGLKVDGPGSRFSAAFSGNNAQLGAVFYWRTKAQQEKLLQSLPYKEVQSAISQQLKKAGVRTLVIIRKLDVAYYDSNVKLIQPVYRYMAELPPPTETSHGRSGFYVGYVPFDKGLGDDVPELGGQRERLPTPLYRLPPYDEPPPNHSGPSIAVGRYVTKGHNAGFIRDSNAFFETLTSTRSRFTFEDVQNNEAWRFMFTSRKNLYVNGVDLALVEAHGSPWTFMTHEDFAGEVNLTSDVPLDGYGVDAGGNLKHLILHSCRVVPTSEDKYISHHLKDPEYPLKEWAREWWGLFNGLSSVVGYRTSMFIDDGAGAAFAKAIAQDEPVVPAWFGAVSSLNIYGPNSWEMTYCAKNEPMGRASAIAVCNDGSDPDNHDGARATIEHRSTARPDCLEAWWLGDNQVPFQPIAGAPPITTLNPGVCPDEGDKHPPLPKPGG